MRLYFGKFCDILHKHIFSSLASRSRRNRVKENREKRVWERSSRRKKKCRSKDTHFFFLVFKRITTDYFFFIFNIVLYGKNPLRLFFFQTFLAKFFFLLRIQHQIIYLFKNGIIRLEAGAFKFLRNRLFMTSMQLPRKMSRSLLWRRENNIRYSAK